MITLLTRGGLSLAADRTGPVDGPPVIFLHGGGQTRHSWGGALASLGAAGFFCTTLDLRGHGESEWARDADYSLEALRDDLIDVLAQLPGGPAAVVGASLGGLTALLAAGDPAAPAVRALVLVDVVPQIEMEGAMEIRAFMTANPAGFGSPDEAADAVAAYLPHRKRPRDNTGLLRNLRLRDDGKWYWHWDPQMLEGSSHSSPMARRGMLEDAAARVRVPTLLIRGGRSRVVSLEGVRALQAVIPHAEFVNIEDADHMVAGDANDRFNAPLLDFMERTR
jgi:pimeloyl-ACP methyl ester carboxylesterase